MIIVGLGNPGTKYEKTYHNAGFMALDCIAKKLNVKIDQKGCEALYGITYINSEKVVLAKPQTFMNLSGVSVKQLAAYFKEEINNIIIIFDDIELPIGTIRIRKEGSGGTHNGMKNIIQELNTKSIPRIRLGLSDDRIYDLKDYVLSNIPNEKMNILNKVFEKLSICIEDFIVNKDLDKLMQKCNGMIE